MKTVYARIKAQGLIQITTDAPFFEKGADQSGDLKNYKIESPNQLLNACRRCHLVQRPNGRLEAGKMYTLKKATGDFNALTKK